MANMNPSNEQNSDYDDNDNDNDDNDIDEQKLSKQYALLPKKQNRYVIVSHDMQSILQTIRTFDIVGTNADIVKYQELITKLITDNICSIDDIMRYKHIAIKFPHTISIIKNYFHKLIVDQRQIEIIDKYNEIFNDNIYSDIESYYDKYPIFPQDVLNNALDEYNKSIAKFLKQKHTLLKMPNFYDGQIIGAKDREGKWWLAQVITNATYGQHRCYYVSFCGWDKCFNEWISDQYRLQEFNPKRHRLFRRVMN